jgi:hypothetical protein
MLFLNMVLNFMFVCNPKQLQVSQSKLSTYSCFHPFDFDQIEIILVVFVWWWKLWQWWLWRWQLSLCKFFFHGLGCALLLLLFVALIMFFYYYSWLCSFIITFSCVLLLLLFIALVIICYLLTPNVGHKKDWYFTDLLMGFVHCENIWRLIING